MVNWSACRAKVVSEQGWGDFVEAVAPLDSAYFVALYQVARRLPGGPERLHAAVSAIEAAGGTVDIERGLQCARADLATRPN
jgi:hypothetical protein